MLQRRRRRQQQQQQLLLLLLILPLVVVLLLVILLVVVVVNCCCCYCSCNTSTTTSPSRLQVARQSYILEVNHIHLCDWLPVSSSAGDTAVFIACDTAITSLMLSSALTGCEIQNIFSTVRQCYWRIDGNEVNSAHVTSDEFTPRHQYCHRTPC